MKPVVNTRRAALLAATCLAALAAAPSFARAGGKDSPSDAARAAISDGRAKNVIMFLGDGMGDSEITVARNYVKGAAGHLAMDALPLTGAYTTYAVKRGTRSTPEYVTDSAASGTGWATGHKTYNNAISVDPVTGKPMTTILELAKRAGFRTGDVTTAELTDATPAVLASHISQRACQGPADTDKACAAESKKNGGLGSIAEQMVETGVDVLLGGGRARFDQTVTGGPYTGKTVTQEAQALGYTLATDSASLAATTAADKVLGLFHPGNMDLEWTGELANAYTSDTAPNTQPAACATNSSRPASEPHLADMTRKALDLLQAKVESGKDRPKDAGFFLQVEGASIDKQDHAENPCGQIGETNEFDRSIAVAQAWVQDHPDTLVIVTADHGHTSQIVEYPQTAAHHSPGVFATLLTADGQPMVVSYATVANGSSSRASQDHTGTEVRLAAQGPQAARVLGVTDQTDLFRTMAAALGL